MLHPISLRRGRLILRHLTIVLAVALSTAIAVSPAAAAKPIQTTFTYSFTGFPVIGICAFPISLDGIVNISQTDFTDSSGALTRSRSHVVQQDTFYANGKTLLGSPYTFNAEILFDDSGTMTHFFASGVIEKIPLPDGSLFIAAGRVDFLNHPGPTFVLSPDKGNPGDVAKFCGALAP